MVKNNTNLINQNKKKKLLYFKKIKKIIIGKSFKQYFNLQKTMYVQKKIIYLKYYKLQYFYYIDNYFCLQSQIKQNISYIDRAFEIKRIEFLMFQIKLNLIPTCFWETTKELYNNILFIPKKLEFNHLNLINGLNRNDFNIYAWSELYYLY